MQAARGWARLMAAVRPAGVMLLAAALGACATRPDQVDVTVGIALPQVEAANSFAALYAPYAMMATAAYTLPNVLTTGNRCPDPRKLVVHQPGDDAETYAFNKATRDLIAELNRHHWRCDFGIIGSLPCPENLGRECRPVGGLEFFVWRRMQGGVCREVAIAFRGTARDDPGAWVSNFRFLYRLAPRFDQYDQVRTHIREIIGRIKQGGCGGKETLFVSVGHSLGGGLAQQAAYADGTIRYVYSFDPSPVTGIFDISAIFLAKNTEGLGVDRAYEAGEILALPRILIDNIIPPTPCAPRIRTVRFSLLGGSPIARHSIADLTAQLRAMAQTPGADPQQAVAIRAAQDCSGLPLPPFLVPPG